MIYVDRLAWLHNDRFDLGKIRLQLTVDREVYQEDSISVELWEEADNVIGVPRAWALWEFPRQTIVDRSTCPKIEWPRFSGTWRTGQERVVSDIVEHFKTSNGALMEAPCGSGKTVCSLAIASILGMNTLVLVHKDDLAKQWHEAAAMFPGCTVGHVQCNRLEYEGKHVVTAMAQTIHSRADTLPESFFKAFGLVILDESNLYGAATLEGVLRRFHAKYRLGVSATWRRRDKMECVWEWHIGTDMFQMNADRLTGKYIQVHWATRVQDTIFTYDKKINHGAYVTAISKNILYNEWLVKQLIKAARAGRRVLLVSHRTAQLSNLRSLILQKNPNVTVGYYAGTVDGKVIKEAELEAAKECQIILGTFGKVSIGTDIPTLDTLILATPSADVEQIVGRIQRLQLDKKPLLIVDPVWSTHYNRALAKKRKAIYDRLGFEPT